MAKMLEPRNVLGRMTFATGRIDALGGQREGENSLEDHLLAQMGCPVAGREVALG
jgi:hypothetical protein